MGIPVMILGESGSGKTSSIRSMSASNTLIIQPVKKPLPFRCGDWKPWDMKEKTGSVVKTDNWQHICAMIHKASDYGKDTIILDDFQYVLANEFINRAHEKGYGKYNELADHVWRIVLAAQNAHDNMRIYFMWHPDSTEGGRIKPKTIGKLLDEKLDVSGMFTICLRCLKRDGLHIFLTSGGDNDPVKTPFDMFEQAQIENDLMMVDNAITEYYGIKTEDN